MSKTPSPRANKNWLLIQFRKWHSWGGVFLSLFIMIVAITGIMLNHKDLFFHSRQEDGKVVPKASGLLTSSTNLETLPVTFASVLSIAKEHFGDGPLEKVELKDERGWLIYKVVRGKGQELIIDARTGEMTTKYGMKVAASRLADNPQATALAGKSVPPKGLNWAKIVDDLHTGALYGSYGRLLVDFTSLVIIGLTLSGLYLWGVPLLRKKRSAQARLSQPISPRAAGSIPEAARRPARQPVETQAAKTVFEN